MDNKEFFGSHLFQELLDDLREEERFSATYRVEADTFEDARERAVSIASEQTVECPDELIRGTWIAEQVVGHVEDIKKAGPGAYYVVISYLPEAVESDFTEFLNMVYGNVSLFPGVRLLSLSLPEAMESTFRGPKFGQSGLRDLCGVPRGPILMSAVKPLGRSAAELASMAGALALGGCPIIKDDHSLYDQRWAPFGERVRRMAEAVHEANQNTGGHSIYVANCSGDGLRFLERAFLAQDLGADGIMAAPALVGLSMVKALADDPDFHLPIFIHPCFSGTLVQHEESGIAPYCYYGQIGRLAGADGIIFTSFGGRFIHSEDECALIAAGISAPMRYVKPAFPIPSGGMKWELFPRMVQVYGTNSIFLVGGALQTQGPDLTDNTRFFLEKLREACGE